MPISKSRNFEHPDTWEDLLLDHVDELKLSDIDFYDDLNIPMVIWKKDEYEILYSKRRVIMRYGNYICEISYKEFLVLIKHDE